MNHPDQPPAPANRHFDVKTEESIGVAKAIVASEGPAFELRPGEEDELRQRLGQTMQARGIKSL